MIRLRKNSPGLLVRLATRKQLACFAAILIAFSSVPGNLTARAAGTGEVSDSFKVVDCLLPGQVMKLGRQMTYATQRRPARLSVGVCETRGGEYVAYDRTSSGASLNVWMPLAAGGDAKAQLYVGQLSEQGINGVPDYEMAKLWYERAAAQGSSAAMFNLGHMYEQGKGVAKNKAKATEWYSKAYGVDAGDVGTFVAFGGTERLQTLQRDVSRKSAEIQNLKKTVSALETEAASAETQRRNLSEQLKTKEASLQEASQTIARMTQDLSAARTQNASAVTDYREALKRVDAETAATDPQREALAEREAELDAEARELAKARQQLEEEMARELGKVDAIKSAFGELEALRSAVNDERQQLASLQSQKAAAAAQKNADAEQLADLRRDLDKQLADLAKQEAALAAREKDLAENLSSQTASTQASERDLQKRQEKIAEEQTDLAAARQELADEIALLDQKRAAQTKRESDFAALQDQISAQLGLLAKREAALKERQSQLADTARQAATTDQSALAALAELERSQGELAAESARVDQERKTLAQESTALQKKLTEIEKAEAALADRSADFKARVAALNAREQEVAAREQKAAQLETSARDAQKKLAALEEILSGSQRSLGSGEDTTSAISPAEPRMRIDFGEYHAILIGNANYQDPKWTDLDTPHNDVKRIDEILRDRYGFNTTVILDGTRNQILEAIEEANENLKSQDNLLIYYAGHGTYEDVTKTGFWEPSDAVAGARRNSISADDINRFLSTVEAGNVLVVSDSCYSGAFARGVVEQMKTVNELSEREKFYAVLAAKRSRTVMTAGGLAPVSDNLGNGHSLFARAFINALVDNGRVVHGRELFGRVHNVVVNSGIASKFDQEPRYADLQFSGHEGGDFVFVPEG